MKALIQRVSEASVTVKGEGEGDVESEVVGRIGPGILLLLGLEKTDDAVTADKLLQRVLNYRIFADTAGRMNLSLRDTGGGLLVVSQFTLVADTRKGLRPGFSAGASPQEGERLYDLFVQQAHVAWHNVATGRFGADMRVALVNDGPVTFWLES